jgi:hypothetical protein
LATLARLVGHSPTSISRYRDGNAMPKRAFFLDLFDKAPYFGVSFHRVAAPLGFRWIESRDHRKFRRFSDFFTVVRIQSGDRRDLCAAKLGVSEACIRDVEHGVVPDGRVIANFVRQYFAPGVDVAALKAALPVLDPSDVEQDLRERVVQLQRMDRRNPNRMVLESDLAKDLLRIAGPMARKAGLALGRPRDADEVCGEAVFRVMRKFESRRGLLLPYLKKMVGVLIRELNRIDMQSGVAAALRKYGPRYKEAWTELSQDLRRDPTERELINYSGLSESAVIEVAWALRAGFAEFVEDFDQGVRNLEIVLHPYDEPDYWSGGESVERVRRLPHIQQELLFMRFVDELSPSRIAGEIGRPEDEVELKLNWAVAQLGG